MTAVLWLLLRTWLSLQVLLVVAWSLCALLQRSRLFAPGTMLRLARAFFAAAFVFAAVAHAVPTPATYRPPVQVWFAEGRRGTESVATLSSPLADASRPPLAGVASSPLLLGIAAGALVMALLATGAVVGARRRLLRILAATTPWKRIGRIELRRGTGTFAVALRGRAVVVVDSAATGVDCRVGVAHELQHHRQGDARLALPIWLALATSALNPAARAWRRLFESLEELACDAAVLGRGHIAPRDYAESLLRAAALPTGRASAVPFATTLTPRVRRALLTRRILMITRPLTETRRPLRLVAGGAAAALLVLAACASDDLVADHRVSAEQAAALARQASTANFVIPTNAVIVEALNRRVGTPDGRARARQAVQRASALQAMVLRHLDAHGVPRALAAVPLVESGYENLPAPTEAERAERDGYDCAGLWQFIPETARTYGLRVDAEAAIDERTDMGRSSDAAARLLRDLHDELGDWGLALAAYNEGPKKVRAAIAAEGTRDPWELIRRGALGRYAAEVMAASIVVADPSLVADE